MKASTFVLIALLTVVEVQIIICCSGMMDKYDCSTDIANICDDCRPGYYGDSTGR